MLSLLFFLYGQPIPLDSWVYPVLDRFETKGVLVLPNTRPYDREELAAQLTGIAALGIDGVYLEELIQELKLELKFEQPKRLVARPLVTKTSSYRLDFLPGVFFSYENLPRSFTGADLTGWGVLPPFDVSGKIKISHFFAGLDSNAIDGRVWRNSSFEIESAVLADQYSNFNFSLGKTPFFYGPAKFGGLVLSPNAFGLDVMNAKVHAGDFYFTTFFSILEPGRYLSSHRLDVVKRHFKLGFTEMVLYAKTIEFEYLIPLIPYYASQYLKNRDDNIMWAIDGSLLLKNAKFYGELLIDDFMFERTPAPNKLGWTVGLKLADPLGTPGTDLVVEYTRVDKWVYTQRDSLNRFVRNIATDRTLGYFIGPDGDLLNFELNHRLSYLVAVDAGFSLGRQGEGRIDRSFEREGGSWNPPFPSGIVETKIEPSLGLDIRPHWCFEIKPRIGYEWITNQSNAAGDNRRGLKLSLAAQINF
jgi:hypothetical protein